MILSIERSGNIEAEPNQPNGSSTGGWGLEKGRAMNKRFKNGKYAAVSKEGGLEESRVITLALWHHGYNGL